MADILGSEMSASVGGTAMIVQTNANQANFNPNYQPIYRGTGSDDGLVGYYPGLAQGTFTIVTDMYPASLAALAAAAGLGSGGAINDPSPVAVSLNFGSGGIHVTAAKCSYFEVSGQQGGLPQIRAEFTVAGPPVAGAGSGGGSVAIEQPLVFTDMNASTLLGGSTTDVTAFQLFVRRTFANKRINNHSLYAAVVKQSRAEVGGSVTRYNTSSSELAAFVAGNSGCPTLGTVSISLTQQCVPDVDGDPGTAAGAAFSVGNVFYTGWASGGNDDEFLTETLTLSSMRGTFSFT